ncbi:MAG: hypothetical protein M3Y42_06740 [Actinomycetota bacterium]|nr:hypothetical protein [Actinomycetota bacterium]MDQ2956641.1 hypothetical protein [Actinomycetota bacterium]
MRRLLAGVRRRPVRARWLLLAVAVLLGLLLFSVTSTDGLRSGLSYAGGLVLVGALFEFGSFNIRLAGRILPELSLAIAMISYLTTALVLALVLIASSPRVVDGLAVAIGLFVGVTIWLGGELAGSWVVQEGP